MPAKDAVRFPVYMSAHTNGIVEGAAEKHQIGKSAIFETLVLGCEVAGVDMGALIEAGKVRRREVNPDKRKTRTDTLAKLQRLPKEQLEQLLAAAEKQGVGPA